MARYKPDLQQIQNIEDADKVLLELRTYETQLERIDADAEREIATIKEKASARGKTLRERIKELTATLKAFSDFHRKDLFLTRKSVERPFGIFGYRKNPDKIAVSKDTIQRLKDIGRADCVRIKETVNKEALRDFTDEELAAIGAVRKSSKKEDFFCQTKRDQVNQDMISQTA
jgi:phage host-nuclease inhibitor protein Gam